MSNAGMTLQPAPPAVPPFGHSSTASPAVPACLVALLRGFTAALLGSTNSFLDASANE
jgi:hypothetical protein